MNHQNVGDGGGRKFKNFSRAIADLYLILTIDFIPSGKSCYFYIVSVIYLSSICVCYVSFQIKWFGILIVNGIPKLCFSVFNSDSLVRFSSGLFSILTRLGSLSVNLAFLLNDPSVQLTFFIRITLSVGLAILSYRF